jgi:hypothetical protein
VAGFPKSLRTEADRRISKNLTKLLTNLAKHGDPVSITPGWEAQTKTTKTFLTIGKPNKAIPA